MPPQGAKHAKHNKRKAAAARQGRQAGQGKRKVVERDTDVFKRRKFIKNNHVESEKEDEESSEEEEVQHTNYGKLLQVFGGSGDAGKSAIDSEDDEDDEDDDSEDESDHNGVAEEVNLAVDDGLEEGLEDSDLEVDGEEEGDISDLSDGAEDSDQNDEGGGSEHDEENVHEEKSDDDEGGDEEGEEGEEGGKDGEAGGDPFSSHVDTTLSAELVKVLGARSWRSSSLALPGAGRVQVQVPAAPGEQAVPAARALDEMGLKEKVAAAVGELGERPRALLSVMASYQDLCYTERAQAEGEELRRAYCAHALNHMLKTRAKILQNNQKHEAREAGEDRLRDQGFTRPKVLIIVPFKEAARRVVETLISLLFPDGTKGNVSNRKRFDQDYRKVVTNRKDKPDDYYDTFEGDLDDSFKLGLAVTKNSLKLYTDFYNSDILVSSPLGLRLVTGLEGEEGEGRREEGDTDFLSSIELVVVDQADVLLMSNWDHLATVVDQLNLQPKESHGVDFGRVRLWSLDGQARHYRQTILLSGVPAPQINTIWNQKCNNYRGKVRVANPVAGSGSLARVLADTPLVWHRVACSSLADSLEQRFKYLTERMMPQFSRDAMDHTLLFVPNYFDFVKVRNWFKASDLDYAEISEYSKDKRVAKARDQFYHNEKHFLLYTGRAHFYRRFRIKGVRHLVIYQPPTLPGTLADLANLQQQCFQNPRGGSESNMSCTVLYTRYDTLQLAGCVGSETAGAMLAADSPVHRLQPRAA